ncbi:hypothetical protein [Anaerocolumna sp. MB42-C2]|uniref:hypothetical protein n=1 Tax=Anaerocolumna sp. MB42-C2 TaxID=3070997 RepID=UPI0027E0C9CE|nr:hypothetical protein [Anaerocolumna sp. MB42-C2]WMJ88267.1 hypothetical protein RBU59_01800 [Anaerocolumna sp. MB42-C2]
MKTTVYGKSERKTYHSEDIQNNHIETHFELFSSDFVLPLTTECEVRVKENFEKERLPLCDSFTPFYLWQYRRQACDMQWV